MEDVALGVAGCLCLVLAIGHATLGLVWVLPSVSGESLPKTPFGPPTMTAATLHASWHIVTVFVVAIGALLLMLALGGDVDPRTLTLRVFAAAWMAVALVAIWAAVRRVRSFQDLIRLPVPVFFVVVAALCWCASI